ncbi:hypothetical protein CDEST_05474 [Colletotrichum destructivum]|uniref:Uncharacterized protein n=1 Tax=Colletotrichum destructivum TaxID=34406 RepID=A0AAX4IBR2_9PEZI|nr:hypothetical protein CDEST_05474 [Colletotrichum destructivum]
MTRRLPWDRDGPETLPTPTKPTTATPRKAATPGRATTPKATGTPAPLYKRNGKRARSNDFLGDRSPPTSPPPEPIPEIFMTEGLDNDDGYRMVEDELFTIAGQFTAHLHAAEYQRLKAQTRSQNAETIKNISRPVVGSLTELARKRQEELLRKKKQREALRRAKQEAGREDDESGDETGVPWRGTSLQGLMHSRKKQEVPLMALTRADLGTKASSVFGGVVKSQSQRPATATRRDEDDAETEDESDDLGDLGQALVRGSAVVSKPSTARPAHPPKPAAKATSRPSPQPSSSRVAEAMAAAHSRRPSTTVTAKSVSPTTTATKTKPTFDEDEDDDDIFTRFKNRKANSRSQRRVPETKKDEQESKGSRDIIPSFI